MEMVGKVEQTIQIVYSSEDRRKASSYYTRVSDMEDDGH